MLSNSLNSNRCSKWVVIGLLWLVAALNCTDRMTIFSVFPLLKKEMGVSGIILPLLGSIFLWAYAACSPRCTNAVRERGVAATGWLLNIPNYL
jgi:hypothetical protein